MKYISPSGSEAGEATFARQVKERSGVKFDRCYQCLTCALSCPVFFAFDYLPNQIIRMIQLGAKSEVLQSSTIWLCASCETCVTRCPYEIDIPRLMDNLRQIAIEEKVSGKETAIPTFHQIFLRSIRQWGKQYELGMLLELKLRVRDLFSDLGLGIRMLCKAKLSLLPGTVKARREIRNIFKKSAEGRD